MFNSTSCLFPAYQFEVAFNLAATESQTSIPLEVMTRCYGKQTPIAPHAQRALLASQKEAKLEKGKGKGKGEGTDDSKSKPKTDNGKAKGKPKTTKKSKPNPETGASGPDPEAERKDAKPKSQTATEYSKAKRCFMDAFLNSI